MIPTAIALNPFALMMDPSLVIATMEHSAQLRNLRHRKCHPLDVPLIARRVSRELQAFDAAIDAASAANKLDTAAADAMIDAALGVEPEPLLN
jgi:hypothetical protein